MKTKRVTMTAMFTAISLIIYVIEAQIPPVFTVPGIKPGLANVVTLAAMALLGRRSAGIVLFLRIVLASIFTGNAASFIYSISGGICAYIVMGALIGRLPSRQLWVVSVLGAIAHNAGQLAASALMLGSAAVLWYAPALIIAGILAGTFTGLGAQVAIDRLNVLK